MKIRFIWHFTAKVSLLLKDFTSQTSPLWPEPNLLTCLKILVKEEILSITVFFSKLVKKFLKFNPSKGTRMHYWYNSSYYNGHMIFSFLYFNFLSNNIILLCCYQLFEIGNLNLICMNLQQLHLRFELNILHGFKDLFVERMKELAVLLLDLRAWTSIRLRCSTKKLHWYTLQAMIPMVVCTLMVPSILVR